MAFCSLDNVDEGDTDGNVGNNNNESRNRNKRKYWKQETLQNMHDVLSQALTDRARLIRVMLRKKEQKFMELHAVTAQTATDAQYYS